MAKLKISDGSFLSKNSRQTFDLGREIGNKIRKSNTFLLIGPLGAGKTVLTKGICKGLKVKDFVNSPSYKIVNEYKGRLPVYPAPRQKSNFSKMGAGRRQKFTKCGVHHIDLYRLGSAKEINNLGLDEYIYGEGITIIEWAEKLGKNNLPKKRIEISIKVSDNSSGRKAPDERIISWQQYL